MPGVHLTRRAARDLRDIHARSAELWGKDRADAYIAALYAAFARAPQSPILDACGRVVPHPLMVPSGRHFVVYDHLDDRVVILTVLHQVRDIERIIADLGPVFLAEIAALRRT